MVPALTRVFSNALARGVSNVSFSDLSADLGRTMYEFKFRRRAGGRGGVRAGAGRGPPHAGGNQDEAGEKGCATPTA